MRQKKIKKLKIPAKEFTVISVSRSNNDWDKLINDAKAKESGWKFMKEMGQGGPVETEDNLVLNNSK